MAETSTRAKRAAKKATPTKRAAATKPTVSASHKAAMAKGREEGAAVNRYLDALEAAAAAKKRGRKRTPESIQARIDALVAKAADAPMTKRLALIEERRALQSELDNMGSNNGVDPEKYADDFVKVVKSYSDRKGISYGTWREIGVSPELLKRAGVKR